MASEESETTTQQALTAEMNLETATTCQLQDVEDTWAVDDLDYGDELRDAIATVRDDHDEEVLIDSGRIWMHKVVWNEKTDSVWVETFGYNRGMTINEESGVE